VVNDVPNLGTQNHIRKKQKGEARRLTPPTALREDGLGPPAAPGDEPATGLRQGAKPPATSGLGGCWERAGGPGAGSPRRRATRGDQGAQPPNPTPPGGVEIFSACGWTNHGSLEKARVRGFSRGGSRLTTGPPGPGLTLAIAQPANRRACHLPAVRRVPTFPLLSLPAANSPY